MQSHQEWWDFLVLGVMDVKSSCYIVGIEAAIEVCQMLLRTASGDERVGILEVLYELNRIRADINDLSD